MSIPQKEQNTLNENLIPDKELEILLEDEQEMLREEEVEELMHRMTDEDEEILRKNEEEYVLHEMKVEFDEMEFDNDMDREISDKYENFVHFVYRLESKKAEIPEEKEKIQYDYKKRLCASLEIRRILDVIVNVEKLSDIKEIIDDQINKEVNERMKKLKHVNFI